MTLTRTQKPIEKLRRGTLDGNELRALLKKEGWMLDRVKGSHEIWKCGSQTFVLATHSKELKPYQIKEARRILLKEERADATEEK
ncbi:MAG: type II toxin-antitoxin system HicA family toxin [Deltaproteobacteria bacterium]|nr:type II toxin-antitoxin system HicA family toxin [Deltaproteobacteria bacterium]